MNACMILSRPHSAEEEREKERPQTRVLDKCKKPQQHLYIMGWTHLVDLLAQILAFGFEARQLGGSVTMGDFYK